MLAAVSRGLMNDPANQPWLLYGLGGIIAVILYMSGVPMLAFALGMYLPIYINMAVLAGAFCAWVVSKTGGSEAERKAREEQGPLIASGLMAGAAIIGIVTAILRLPAVGAPIRFLSLGIEYDIATVHGTEVLTEKEAEWFTGSEGQLVGVAMYLALAVACYFLARLGAKWSRAGNGR
jgi:hypothetical protein